MGDWAVPLRPGGGAPTSRQTADATQRPVRRPATGRRRTSAAHRVSPNSGEGGGGVGAAIPAAWLTWRPARLGPWCRLSHVIRLSPSDSRSSRRAQTGPTRLRPVMTRDMTGSPVGRGVRQSPFLRDEGGGSGAKSDQSSSECDVICMLGSGSFVPSLDNNIHIKYGYQEPHPCLCLSGARPLATPPHGGGVASHNRRPFLSLVSTQTHFERSPHSLVSTQKHFERSPQTQAGGQRPGRRSNDE